MVKPINKVLVSIPQAFEEEIVTESGFRFYKDPTYQKEWNATVTGTIAVMSDLVNEENKPIFNELDLGVEVAFDYKVVADFDYASDEKHFHEVTPEGSIHIRKYVNKIGEWISVRSYPTHFGKKWVGWLQDRFLNHIDGVEGNENRLEKWLANFTFGKTDAFVFRNKIHVNKKPYWVVDFSQIIAVKHQGVWKAVGDYVCMCPLEVDVTKKVSITAGGIHIPEGSIKMRFFDRALHLNGAEKLGIGFGEVISFEEKYVIRYEIEGKQYFFIKQSRVDGIWPQS